MELQANTLVTSASGNFAVELKMQDSKTKRWVTVTYRKEGNAYIYIYGNMYDSAENIKNYLEKN